MPISGLNAYIRLEDKRFTRCLLLGTQWPVGTSTYAQKPEFNQLPATHLGERHRSTPPTFRPRPPWSTRDRRPLSSTQTPPSTRSRPLSSTQTLPIIPAHQILPLSNDHLPDPTPYGSAHQAPTTEPDLAPPTERAQTLPDPLTGRQPRNSAFAPPSGLVPRPT